MQNGTDRYTASDSLETRQKIEEDLQIMLNRLRNEYSNLQAVILIGGFGRGEGSVLTGNGVIEPVNDYDLALVFNGGVDTAALEALSRELAKELKIRLVDLIPIQENDMATLPPTQFNYDMKYGGRLLWGDAVLNRIPDYRPADITIDSGKQILLNRLICALECYSEDFEKRAMTQGERFFLVNQTAKVIFGCVEALLIQIGKYHHSYKERAAIFEREFPRLEEMVKLNHIATDFKLRPTRDMSFEAIGFWDAAIRNYLPVLSVYLSEFLDNQRAGDVSHLHRLRERKSAFWGRYMLRVLEDSSNTGRLTNHPIERVEMAILFSKKSGFLTRRRLLGLARNELEAVTKKDCRGFRWERMRKEVVATWHGLFH